MITAALCVAALAGTAAAQIYQTDDLVHGPGSLTLDTNSSLEWLDVTRSTNMAPDFVSTQFGAGGLFEGFRYATIAELTTLFSHAGIPDISFGPGTLTSANYAPVSSLMALVGTTVTTPEVLQSFGFLGESSPFVPQNRAVGALQAYAIPRVGSADPVQASGPHESQFEIVGHFLVRVVTASSLASVLESVNIEEHVRSSLRPVVEAIRQAVEAARLVQADRLLAAFVREVRAREAAGQIDAAAADALVLTAQNVRNSL